MAYVGLRLPLDKNTAETYCKTAEKYAILCGVANGSEEAGEPLCRPASLSMLPCPFPERSWSELTDIQPAYTQLYHRVAHDFHFLEEHLKPVAEVDAFFGRLWKIHEAVKYKPLNQHRCVMLARNDFMLSGCQPKQTEINTVNVGGVCGGQKIRDCQNWLLRTMGCGNMEDKMPFPQQPENFAADMVKALNMYDKPACAILFVVTVDDLSVYDRLMLERSIYRHDPDVKVLHRNVIELDKTAELRDGRLFVNEVEVGLVYYRSLSSHEGSYFGEVGWRVRLMFETSRAVLAPCIHTVLAGAKKVQQVLSRPGMIEKYIEDPATVAKIRRTFVSQYPTDHTLEGDFAVQLAIANPDKYILKPQREGGGNNLYGGVMVAELDNLRGRKDRGKYILMEKICPPINENYLIKNGEVLFTETVSEIGLYVSSFWSGGASHSARWCGYYVRTKPSHADEGGVTCGVGGYSSLILV